MLKNSLLSLALAGTLSASQFTEKVKDFFPQNSAQELNVQKKQINAHKLAMTSEMIEEHKKHLDVMMGVNERTFTDFIPTAQTSLQRWSKEDIESTSMALELMLGYLDIRLKQYSNMKLIYKKANAPKELVDQIALMDKMSREAKKQINEMIKESKIISSINEYLSKIDDVNIIDFWIPVIEEKSNIMVKVAGIDENDFDKIDELESRLNSNITHKSIDTIMVA